VAAGAGTLGVAIVKGKRHALKEHTLLLIEHGERHEIRNTGRTSLKTLNFYSPSGYTKSGDELSPLSLRRLETRLPMSLNDLARAPSYTGVIHRC
jgi:hypothetical protein